MNDADMDKVWDALSGVVNLEAALSNLLGRGERAGKYWASWLKAGKPDADQTKNMKAALAELTKLLKNAKVVKKDIDAATKLARKENLAKVPTPKDFREKVLTKQFASLYAFEQSGQKFVTSLNAVIPPHPYPKSPAAIADVTVTYDSIKETVQRSDAMRKTLARL